MTTLAPARPASIRYRDLTPAQRDAWHTAETRAHAAAEAANIDAILGAWAIAAAALGLHLTPGSELADCGCDCGCDRIHDLAAGAATVNTPGAVQTPICPTCWDEHPPADDYCGEN